MSIFSAKRQEEISAITLDDICTIVALYCKHLNYGDGVRPHFERVLSDPDNIALKYTVDGEIAGFYIYTKGIHLSCQHPELQEKLVKLSEGKKVYTGDAVFVKREYRRLSTLMKGRDAMLAELRRRNVELVVHELWVHPDGHVPAGIMTRIFRKNIFLGRQEKFYKDFHLAGFICPICGINCICAADIYLCEVPRFAVADPVP